MMRTWLHTALILAALLYAAQSNAQCAFGGTLLTNINPTGAGFTVSNPIRGGFYVTVAVCSGATYTFSTCGDVDFDTQITVFNEATTAVVAYNDDGCGLQSTVTWVANFTGTVRVLVNQFSCQNTAAALQTTLTVTQTTACGTVIFPPNDGCAGAIPIACGQTITGSTADASPEPIVAGCGNNTSRSEWYSFVGNGQSITASLCGSAYDTFLSVLTGTCAGTLTCVGFNDNFCATQSQVTFLSVVGQTYFIRVSGNGTASGNYSLALTCSNPIANDGCAGALPIACGQTITGSTSDATPDAIPAGCGNATSASEWYVFTGNGQNITASLCGSAYDTWISVVTGPCGGTQTCIASSDDFCGAQSQVTFLSITGQTYYIRVAGFGSGSGNYTLALICTVPAVNDGCAGALPIACGQTIAGSTLGATAEPNLVGCGNATSPTLWYSFVGTGQLTTVSLCGSAFDTQLGIITGPCGGAQTCVLGNDDLCGAQSQVTFSSVLGVTYYIRVGGFGTQSGAFTLSLTCVTETGNDPCSGALPIDCGQTVSGSTATMNPDIFPAGCGIAGSAGAWYTFVGNGDVVTLNTCTGSNYDTQISVFNGDCAGLNCVGTNDQFCGDQSQVVFLSAAGSTYYVLVHGLLDFGTFGLSMTCAPYTPTPQECQGAITVCNDQQFNGNSSGSGFNQELNDGNSGCLFQENQSSWYIFSPTTVGTISFTINPTPIVDYDFAVWGPFASAPCPPVGEPLRCSFSGLAVPTGLGNGATDFTEGAAGNAWVAPITITAADLNQFYVMVLDNFSQTTTPFVFDWTLSGVVLDCSLQLPVTYTDWRGEALSKVNRLHWSTATESMNEMFVVERSSDNVNFERIGTVEGHGTTLEAHTYRFDDMDPLPSIAYYRLRQVDWNGDNHLSDAIAVERPTHFMLAPNPASDVVRILFTENEFTWSSCELTDMVGRTIIRYGAEASNGGVMEWSIAHLQPGTYAVVLRSKEGAIVQQERLVVR